MGERLDAAAVRSARVVKVASGLPPVARARQVARAARRAVGSAVGGAVERVEPQVHDRISGAAKAVGRWVDAEDVPGPIGTAHAFTAAPDEFHLGDNDAERCTCMGTGDAWCGATKRDVVHDLMTRGMHLSRPQAEEIWRTAQAARAAAAVD